MIFNKHWKVWFDVAELEAKIKRSMFRLLTGKHQVPHIGNTNFGYRKEMF